MFNKSLVIITITRHEQLHKNKEVRNTKTDNKTTF